jgi:hypothetical protein
MSESPDGESLPESKFVELPQIAAPYVSQAVFLRTPGDGWQRVLDSHTDCETDQVFVVCGDPNTGRYQRCYRTSYSNTEHVVCASKEIPTEALREYRGEILPADEFIAQFTREDGVERLQQGLPGDTVRIGDSIWERERVDEHRIQWILEMDDDQYDWDAEADDISLVGVDTPVRVVSLEFQGSEWFVEALETAGPDYHRPGYTEPIGSEFSKEVDSAESALRTVEQFLANLSRGMP